MTTRWYKTLPREWERPDVPLSQVGELLTCDWPAWDELSLERGDLLRVPGFDIVVVTDIDGDVVTVWPHFGETFGRFSRDDVIRWRNAYWSELQDAGFMPVDMARAMFPENRR